MPYQKNLLILLIDLTASMFFSAFSGNIGLFALSAIGMLGIAGYMYCRAKKERKFISISTIEKYIDENIIELMMILEEFHYLDIEHLSWLMDACKNELEEKDLFDKLSFIFKPLINFLKVGLKLFAIVMAVCFAVILLGDVPDGGIGSLIEIVSTFLTVVGVKEVLSMTTLLVVLGVIIAIEWCLIIRILIRDALRLQKNAHKLLFQNLQFIQVRLSKQENSIMENP